MTWLKSLKDQLKNKSDWVLLFGFNILFSALAMFESSGEYVHPLILPWVVWLLAYVGYIPVGGFALWGFLYWRVYLMMIWRDLYGIPIGWVPKLLILVWLPITFNRSLAMLAEFMVNENGTGSSIQEGQ